MLKPNSYVMIRHSYNCIWLFFLLFICYVGNNVQFINAKKSSSSLSPYKTLAKYLSKSIPQHSVPSIQSALEYLSKSQSTLKSIDGASHEFYQLSHKNTIEGSAGRVERSAGRVGCCADSLLGCELLDWLDRMCVSGGDNVDVVSDYDGDSSKDQGQEQEQGQEEDDDTLDINARKVVLNTTITEPLPLRVVVLYESNYNGGAGMSHGGIDGLTAKDTKHDKPPTKTTTPRGRYLILIKDELQHDLERTLDILDSAPEFFELNVGLVSGEIASVNRIMWIAAQKVLEACWECWSGDLEENNGDSDGGVDVDDVSGVDDDKQDLVDQEDHSSKTTDMQSKSPSSRSELPALHFVGRSLAGGVATLAAILVDGSIPMPTPPPPPPPLKDINKRTRGNANSRRTKSSPKNLGHKRTSKSTSRSRRSSSISRESRDDDDDGQDITRKGTQDSHTPSAKIHGFGVGRASAVALGAPPSISANIKAAFVTSVICGDDIVCRATQKSMERLRQRTTRRLEGGVLMKQVGWMTDALSLTLSSLQSHAHGSEGEEARLSIPGRVYLVRPRRYGGGVSSMHEIGMGRDALRAAVLWQLNDVLLSRSLWKHHSLDSYIVSIDKVGLRTIDTEDSDGGDEQEYDMSGEIFS